MLYAPHDTTSPGTKENTAASYETIRIARSLPAPLNGLSRRDLTPRRSVTKADTRKTRHAPNKPATLRPYWRLICPIRGRNSITPSNHHGTNNQKQRIARETSLKARPRMLIFSKDYEVLYALRQYFRQELSSPKGCID